MKDVSAEFLAAQKNPRAVRVREVYYKRRYWSAADGKYIWEENWRNVEKRDYEVTTADPVVALFELTDGSQEYSSTDVPPFTAIPQVTFNALDEFGIDGAFITQPYDALGNDRYYSITLTSKAIDRTYNLTIHDDQILNTISTTSYAIDTTTYHALRFVIKTDLTLDLYVDGVFAQNMGGGSSGVSSSADDAISFLLIPDSATESYVDTTNTQDMAFGPVGIPRGDSIGVRASFTGLSNYAGANAYKLILNGGLGNARTWSLDFYANQIYEEELGDHLAMDNTIQHDWLFTVKTDDTLDVYLDGVLQGNLVGNSNPNPLNASNFTHYGTITSNLQRRWVQTAVPETAITRIWYQRTLAPSVGSETLTPEQRGTSRIISVSPILWQLDSEQLTEFKVSNVNIVAENTRYEWNTPNIDATSHFGPNADVPAGFEPYWTKFQIRSGFQQADGTKEYVTLFTGLAVKFRKGTQPRTVQIDVLGQEAYMLNASAEDIATDVNDEAAGVGNGILTAFATVNNGVGGISDVRVAGRLMIEGESGTDTYQVSNLDEPTLPATVTFTNPPDIGEAVTFDYFYWPLNQEFNSLVEQLVDGWLNSDPANSTDIHPFAVANSVINSQSYTSEADWNTGTLDKLTSSVFPGSLVIDWENAAFRQATTWANTVSDWVKYGNQQYANGGTNHDILTTDGSKIIFALPAGDGTTEILRTMEIDQLSNGIVGSWSFKARLQGSSFCQLNVKLFGAAGAAGFGNFTIARGSITPMFYGVAYAATDSSEHAYLVTRTASGVVRLYIDTVLTATSTATDTSSAALGFEVTLMRPATGTTSVEVRDINVPTPQAVGTFIGPIIDWTTLPFAWGPLSKSIDLDRNGSLTGASIVFATDVSADNFATSDGYVDMAATDSLPNSTVRRYVRVKITITVDQTQSPEPEVNSLTIQAFSSSIPVVIPKLSGKNVYEAIQSLAAFANYEFGITSDQVFFFRPKATVGDPVMSLAHYDFIQEISDFDSDYDNVYSKVEITYGTFVKRIEAADDDPDSPATRFLKKTFELSADDSIVIAPTADIATAMSQDYFLRLSVLRRRFKVTTKFLPQLEISDLINTLFAFAPPEDTGYVLVKSLFVPVMAVKIIAARYDTDNYQCEFDVEEVPG